MARQVAETSTAETSQVNRVWNEEAGSGELPDYFRPTNMKKGQVVEGTLLGTLTNKMSGKEDYRILLNNGKMGIVNGAGNLGARVKASNAIVGYGIHITYLGKEEYIDKNGLKKTSNQYKVLSEKID